MRDDAQLVLFPGLGVDERLYAPQRAGLPIDIITPRWIEPESDRESLAHYSERMAAALRSEMGSSSRSLYIGGLSLGAVVALEASLHLRTAGVLLISGCRSFADLSPTFQAGCAAVAALPRQWIHPALRLLGPAGFTLFEHLSAGQRQLMLMMMLEHSPRQTRWSIRALRRWKQSAMPFAPVHSIHGSDDEIIPLKNVTPDAIIPGGRHLISLTHAEEVNRFINQCTSVTKHHTRTAASFRMSS